jgi:hypothetical protein
LGLGCGWVVLWRFFEAVSSELLNEISSAYCFALADVEPTGTDAYNAARAPSLNSNTSIPVLLPAQPKDPARAL